MEVVWRPIEVMTFNGSIVIVVIILSYVSLPPKMVFSPVRKYDFLSYIFSVSENTKIIHLIIMIWLLNFIVSSYKLASGPPKDPGGSKKILSKSRI